MFQENFVMQLMSHISQFVLFLQLITVYGDVVLHLKLEYKDANEIPGLTVKSKLNNDITGFQIDMGTEKEAKDHKDPVIFYGKAWVWLNVHYAFHDKQNRLQLATELNKTKERNLFAKRISKEGLTRNINVRCLQPKRMPKGKADGKDECLTLNVIAPPKTSASHPVYVHIHGGSLAQGSAETFGYKGIVRNFAAHDIIVVTLNYRLGPEGFLKVPFLSEEQRKMHGTYAINRGMEDCILALRWVKNNIASFGGDPENISLGGNSAGSSVVEMIALQENQSSNKEFNLFHKIILNGGPFDMCAHFSTYDEDMDEIVQEQMCPRKTYNDDNKMWECLRDPPNPDLKNKKKFKFGLSEYNTDGLFNLWSLKTPDVHGRFTDVTRGLFQKWEPYNKDIKVLIMESKHEHSYIDAMDIRPKTPVVNGEKLPYGEEYLKFALDILLKPYDKFHGPDWAANKVYHRNQSNNQPNIISELIQIYKDDLGIKGPVLKEQDHYQIYIRLVTHMLWSTRFLEDAIRLLRKGHTVFLMRFSHEQEVSDTPVKVSDHDAPTRYTLMYERKWAKQETFHNANELAVADKMQEIMGNFIRNGDPKKSSHVATSLKTTLAQWIWQAFDECKKMCNETFCERNASKHPNDATKENRQAPFTREELAAVDKTKLSLPEFAMCESIPVEHLKNKQSMKKKAGLA